MTSCPLIEALAAFVDDEQDLAGLSEHVAGCAHCQEVVAGFRSDRDLLRC